MHIFNTPFSKFSPHCDSDPLVVHHDFNVKFNFEEKFGYLNLGILAFDLVIDHCTPPPPTTSFIIIKMMEEVHIGVCDPVPWMNTQ